MHPGEFGGGLFAPDLPESTGDDFLLNLRIVQQTQEQGRWRIHKPHIETT
jgi:hypothetical protein